MILKDGEVIQAYVSNVGKNDTTVIFRKALGRGNKEEKDMRELK